MRRSRPVDVASIMTTNPIPHPFDGNVTDARARRGVRPDCFRARHERPHRDTKTQKKYCINLSCLMSDLFVAARYGNVDVIRALVRSGAGVDHLDENDKTPLIYASQYGQVGAIKELAMLRANVNHGDENGLTPLHYASLAGHVDARKKSLGVKSRSK